MRCDGLVAEVQDWAAGLEEVHRRIAGAFARAEPRARVLAYLRGLLGQLERKNGWTLAETAGEVSPDGMQRLLRTADWNADAVRDELRSYVVERLGPGGILIVDETGFVKKGTRSAGVARQCTGTTGKIDNCQVGVFLAYATPAGRALIDRELYLPRAWTDDRDRARAAGIDDAVPFATKPELARRMLTRALDAGVPADWLTADEIYGQDKRLRVWCEQRGLPYVLATRSNDTVATVDWRQRRVRALIAEVPAEAWARRSAGAGAHGLRLYDWARIKLLAGSTRAGRAGCWPAAASRSPPKRHRSWPTTSAPPPHRHHPRPAPHRGRQPLAHRGMLPSRQEQAGLASYQVRDYTAWYRHITLAMLAHAYLSATRATAEKGAWQPEPTSTSR
ncbi:SRSO17 transposase [Geodermatophilus africanus]|uniref:SRSO17 transposase n=1 Tax=Geodermatophilus africanus TaxID=1137993 RepID=A0A1H3RHG9_9ACTN|nr:IS701 family transposase [Geodermatophilus africanus]SDZ25262.1 SRSO17 transposase [Geodermatophilus africanus]